MKNFILTFLAFTMIFAMSISVAAYDITDLTSAGGATIYDEDGKVITTVDSNLAAEVEFDKKIYICVDDLLTAQGLDPRDVSNDKLVKVTARKNRGEKMISKISFASRKLNSSLPRANYVILTSSDNMTDDEEKVQFTMRFRIKKDGALVSTSKQGDEFDLQFTLWVKNKDVSDELRAGQRGIYDPDKNDDNEINWSDEVGEIATLKFDADSDPDKMFVKLSTKNIEEVYETAEDADLYFYDFAGKPKVSSTSRATFMLYDPWVKYELEVPASGIFIYTYSDAGLTDVTENFTWDFDKKAWVTRTRKLETYILSDKPLLPSSVGKKIPAPKITGYRLLKPR